MKSAVIVFPGSNCDRDVAVALEQVSVQAPAMVWHGDTDLPEVDLVVLPGGFSFGDYLRSAVGVRVAGTRHRSPVQWDSAPSGCEPRSLGGLRCTHAVSFRGLTL